MKRFALLLLLIAAGCNSSAGSPSPKPSASPAGGGLGAGAPTTGGAFQGSPSPLYLTVAGSGLLYIYAGANGSSIPETFTSDNSLSGIAIEANTGDLEFTDNNGITTAAGLITTGAPYVITPDAVAVDTNDNLYVVSPIISSVFIFGPTANGNVMPSAQIVSPVINATTSCTNGIAVDASANVYVSVTSVQTLSLYHCSDAIYVFAAGLTGTPNPSAVIAGSKTGLDGITGVAYGQEGIYVANGVASTVTIYPTTANGNVAPFATIGGSNTTLNAPTAITVDAQGYVYVANLFPGTDETYITIFSPGASGNVAPVWTIGTSQTAISGSISDMAAYNSSLLPAARARKLH